MTTMTTPLPEEPRAAAPPPGLFRLAAVTLVWLALAGGLERLGNHLVPDAWKRHVELQTFLIACQVTAAALGLGLSFALLARPREALALVRPRARQVAAAALLAPAVFVGATAVALQAALPALLAEARRRGPHVSRANAGAFGRVLTESPLFLTLLWGVVLAALTEELLFRGALYSLLERAAVRTGPRARGLVAVVGAALIFALMHGDLRGGVGMVRVVSTLCLGLACGVARYATGTLAAPVIVHLVHNTLAIGQTRRWFDGASPPLFETVPVPDALLGLALAGLAAFALLTALAAAARRREARDRALTLDG